MILPEGRSVDQAASVQVKASYKLADELKAKEQKRLNVRQQSLAYWLTCCVLVVGSGRLTSGVSLRKRCCELWGSL